MSKTLSILLVSISAWVAPQFAFAKTSDNWACVESVRGEATSNLMRARLAKAIKGSKDSNLWKGFCDQYETGKDGSFYEAIPFELHEESGSSWRYASLKSEETGEKIYGDQVLAIHSYSRAIHRSIHRIHSRLGTTILIPNKFGDGATKKLVKGKYCGSCVSMDFFGDPEVAIDTFWEYGLKLESLARKSEKLCAKVPANAAALTEAESNELKEDASEIYNYLLTEVNPLFRKMVPMSCEQGDINQLVQHTMSLPHVKDVLKSDLEFKVDRMNKLMAPVGENPSNTKGDPGSSGSAKE